VHAVRKGIPGCIAAQLLLLLLQLAVAAIQHVRTLGAQSCNEQNRQTAQHTVDTHTLGDYPGQIIAIMASFHQHTALLCSHPELAAYAQAPC
jgi:hypothetical protein